MPGSIAGWATKRTLEYEALHQLARKHTRAESETSVNTIPSINTPCHRRYSQLSNMQSVLYRTGSCSAQCAQHHRPQLSVYMLLPFIYKRLNHVHLQL